MISAKATGAILWTSAQVQLAMSQESFNESSALMGGPKRLLGDAEGGSYSQTQQA